MDNLSSANAEPAPNKNSRERLQQLLSEIIQHPDRRTELTQTIEETFGQNKAVMVLDMSGFSHTTQKYGIIAFLLMIQQMQLICRPCVEHFGGVVIKTDADNLFCLFDSVSEAIKASQEITSRLNAANVVLPVESHLYASIGIGYGKILNIGDEDIFGDEVNLASKLGEDIADKGEILLSAAAQIGLGESAFKTREAGVSVSGISLIYHIVEE